MFVEDAWRRQRSVMPRLDTQKQRLLFVWHSRLQPVKYMAILALLLLTWFEIVSIYIYIYSCCTVHTQCLLTVAQHSTMWQRICMRYV
jgi:hypothetical protein